MALTTRRDAELFARLLDGEDVVAAPPALRELTSLAGAIPRPAVSPDPAFVAGLRVRLVAEADARAAAAAAATPARPATVTPRPARPARDLVVRIPHGWAPGLVAGLLGLAVLVGGLSSRALPGDRLYEVKLGIGQAQVRLAGTDLARGRALLEQVDHRLDEVDALVGAGDPRSALVDVALTQASSDLAAAQRILLSPDDGRPDPESLQALSDASAQAEGRLRALAPMMPTASGPSLRHLLDLLAVGQDAIRQEVLACGSPCDQLRRDLARQPAGFAPGTSTGAGGAPGASGSSDGPRPSGGASVGVPATAPTAVPRGTSPGDSATVPGVSVSVPGIGVSLPRPSVPSGALPTGPATAPGAGQPTLTVPPISVTAGSVTASVSTSGCVIGVGGICLGG